MQQTRPNLRLDTSARTTKYVERWNNPPLTKPISPALHPVRPGMQALPPRVQSIPPCLQPFHRFPLGQSLGFKTRAYIETETRSFDTISGALCRVLLTMRRPHSLQSARTPKQRATARATWYQSYREAYQDVTDLLQDDRLRLTPETCELVELFLALLEDSDFSNCLERFSHEKYGIPPSPLI
ncbi:hypothetical protein NMY22_g5963 [Coprinellus aureogranulatus]|nr:hypothetical protein NMY22_g5963 [Coprinellus aureogranulatus]